MDREVVIVPGVRTAIGSFGGSLAGKRLSKIAAAVAREAFARAGYQPADTQQSDRRDY